MDGNVSTLLENPKFIYDYLTCIIPKSMAVSIQRLILHWVKHKGVEWTVARLKDLKAQRIHYEGGSDLIIVRSHMDLTPKGAFRPIWGIDLVKALRVLNIYTSVILPKVTKKQIHKFHSAVKSAKWDMCLPLRTDGIVIDKNYYHPHPFKWIRAENKNAPYIKDGQVSSKEEKKLTFEDILNDAFAFYNNTDHVLKHSTEYAKALGIHVQTLKREAMFRKGELFVHRLGEDPFMWSKILVGRIGYIQERGAKLRAIANPFRHFQMVLTPLAMAFDDLLRRQSWSCVHNQEDGTKFCREKLVEGKTISSIDLSNATDTFPLKVQLEVARSILERSRVSASKRGGKRGLTQPEYQNPRILGAQGQFHTGQEPADLLDELAIFEALARGQWSDREGKDIPFLTWCKGQPLGLVPSFALFTLTHGILIRNIEMKLGKVDTFRVVGDDVVIADPDVTQRYVEELEYMGCEVSSLKTITSSQVAEFVGKVVTTKGELPVEKWKCFSWADPLGVIRTLGLPALKFVPKTVRKRVALLAAAPEPVGLGLNPKGLGWDKRVPLSIQHWWWPVKRSVPSDERLSYDDANLRHHYMWGAVAEMANRFVDVFVGGNHLEKGETLIPFPHDSEVVLDELIYDHISAVNRSRIHPDDPEFVVQGLPSPNRGRFDEELKRTIVRGKNGRLSRYIRECRKVAR